ncbi:MAG: hypothetical protein DMG97_31800 [Acidobacteria bacterium]|nr:MAG: hypothetical protein DMG97_31800 [Acidobacteriota bacterium]
MNNAAYLCSRIATEKVLVACALVCLFGCGSKKGSAEETTSADAIKTPATVEQAARLLDLSTFPLMDGAKPLESPQVANLFYLATGDVKTAFEFNRKALVGQGWKELPNSSVTEQSASAMFSHNGFVVSLSVSPHGEPGSVFVMLQNMGNVKPGQLPVPPGAKPVYVGDPTAMYSTEAALPATTDACRNLFLGQGWVPYGNAGDSVMFKQNAILVTATVSSAPAQGGKTMIQYSTQLISADIPAPPNVEDLRYADQPPELTFETAENQDAIVDFYRKNLATAGWKSTMDKMVAVDDKPTMIFRNPAKDMLTLSLWGERNGKLPVSVRFQSAAEIAELDRRIKEEAPRLRAAAEAKAAKEAAELTERNKVPKVAVTLPADAKDVKQTKDEIKFTVGKGKAKAAVEFFRKQFRDAGWKEIAEILDHEFSDRIAPIAYFVGRRIKHFYLVCVAPMILSGLAPARVVFCHGSK